MAVDGCLRSAASCCRERIVRPFGASRASRRILALSQAPLLALLLALLLAPTQSHGQEPLHRPDDQLLILGVDVGPARVHEGLIAYYDGAALRVPLLELCAALGIPVTGNVESGLAEGWFRSPSRGFQLSHARRILRVDGLDRAVDWAEIEAHETDFYVPLALFASWFALRIEPQLRASRLHLPAGQGLPAELRSERERRWRDFDARRTRPGEHRPVEPYRPRWAGWPLLDVSVGGSAGAGQRQLRANVLAEGEWLRQEARVSLTAARMEGAGIDGDLRVALGRTVAMTGAPGWSLGDVFLDPLPGVNSALEGVGFSLGTSGDTLSGDGFSTSLRGEAPSGWDVELYRNDELLGVSRVGDDNAYRFDDTSVWPGLNVFRIVAYGPEGQVRETLRRVVVGEGALPADARRWRVYGLWPRRRMFDLRDVGDSLEAPPPLFGLSFARALNRHASLSFDLLAADVRGDARAVASLRLRGGFGPLAAEVQALGDASGGSGARVSMQVVHERHELGLQLERAESLWAPERDPRYAGEILDARLHLRWTGRIRPSLPVSMEYQEDRHAPAVDYSTGDASVRVRRTARARVARNWRDAAASLQYERVEERRSQRSERIGGLLTYRRGALDVSGQWNMDLLPEPLASSAQISAAWTTGGYRWRFAYDRQRAAGRSADDWRERLEAGLSRRAARWLVSLKAVHDTERGLGVSVSISTSLQRADAGWVVDARPLASTAAVDALVFLDSDSDGIRDPDEPPIEGVGLSAGTGGSSAFTDASGRVRIDRLPAHQALDVRLRTATLGDPFRIPAVATRRLRLPPGAVARLEFPVHVSSEVDGMVMLESEGRRRSASNVELQAVAADGRVFTARSAFDGAYLFERLPPGRYTLGIAQQQLQRLGLCASPPRTLVLDDPDGGVRTVDWVLVPRAPSYGACAACEACPP